MMYFLFLLIVMFYLVVIFTKIVNRKLRAICIFFLFIPVFSFQEISPKIIPAIIFSCVIAFTSLLIPSGKIKKKTTYYFLMLSVIISLLGVFDFSLLSSRMKDHRQTRQNIKNIFLQLNEKYIELDMEKMNVNDVRNNFTKIINEKKDLWGNQYHVIYKEEPKRLVITIYSTGKDGIINNVDDISYTDYFNIK